MEIRLSAEGPERSRLKLSHIAHPGPHWEQFGPGAVGVGWELGLLGLAMHISDPETKLEEADFHTKPEGRTIILGSSEAWGEADILAGEDPAQARAAARRTGAFYTGEAQTEE